QGSVDVISVQLLLGQIYVAEQRYTEAIAVYDESIKANQQDFRPVLAKALVLKKQGKIAEAKPLFTTAVSLAPPQYKDQVKQLSGDTPVPTSSPPTGTTPAPNSSSPKATTPAPADSPANNAKPDFPSPLPSASP
ncbi:MAG: hypothetical protein F6K28_33315, partial [Microcoleus sp. SIO2G3]|nr:hypothetical protein [Microcoleus sp. SIO2G3]